MANVRITDLPAAPTSETTDEFVLEQSGNSYKVTKASLLTNSIDTNELVDGAVTTTKLGAYEEGPCSFTFGNVTGFTATGINLVGADYVKIGKLVQVNGLFNFTGTAAETFVQGDWFELDNPPFEPKSYVGGVGNNLGTFVIYESLVSNANVSGFVVKGNLNSVIFYVMSTDGSVDTDKEVFFNLSYLTA